MTTARRDAAVRDQPSLFDAPVFKPEHSNKDIERVKGSIADVILQFFRLQRVGGRFFAADLHKFVVDRANIAPASADRVMRDLRIGGQLNYSVVSRQRSEYRVESVS